MNKYLNKVLIKLGLMLWYILYRLIVFNICLIFKFPPYSLPCILPMFLLQLNFQPKTFLAM